MIRRRPVRSRRQADPSPAQARPRRSVCAPTAMAFSFYRRPVLERRNIMSFFSWLRKRTSTRSRRWDGFQIRPTAPRFQPRLEALEDRWLLSTLTVTNNLDSGPGSLRAEIALAQNNDTI